MQDIKQLLEENKNLKKEIQMMQSKLDRIKIWVLREIRQQTHKIAKSKTAKLTSEVKEEFLNENFEEVIANQINNYF